MAVLTVGHCAAQRGEKKDRDLGGERNGAEEQRGSG
jgi:hypothetical protein